MKGGNLVLVTAPTVEPLTVQDDALRQLRLAAAGTEPRPSAPTVALASPAAAGNVENGAHRYAITFVTAGGETDRGDVSEAVTVVDKAVNGQVALTDLPVGSAAVTARKIYRTTAGGTAFLLLATIANNTATTYTDNIADASLGAGAPSSNSTDDSYLLSLIQAAREQVERDTGRALCTQTWDAKLDAFPCDAEPIRIPKPPVQSITSITYTDANGATQTVATSVYLVNATDWYCEISLKDGQSWPTDAIDQANAIAVRFVTGYGAAAAVPAALKVACRLKLLDFYISPNANGAQLTRPDESYERIIEKLDARSIA